MARISPRRLSVRVKNSSYPIVVGMHLEKELVKALRRQGKRRIAIIADTTTRRLFADRLGRFLKKEGWSVEVIHFQSGEKSKNQNTVARVQEKLLRKKFDRDTLVVALGGGVVGDVAGYVAATYLRGVPYIQVPTTLLAMVDSSVGGKVGIDTKYGKNMIGAFYQPRAVVADLAFISSLSKQQVVNGLIEAVKKFMTSEERSLSLVEKLDPAHPLGNPRVLQEIVYRSVRIKARVVMKDEEEKNERKILNFGHTIGHAVEFLSGYTLPHGFAVAYGILVESKISELLGILSPRESATVAAYLRRFGITASGLKKYPVARILRAVKGDKKVRSGVAHYVLLRRLGSVYTKGGQYAHPVPERIVRRAYKLLVK
ncbi:3-dehydroquinate synthase [Candidatus Kaiserbacteria bacterium]|nr:3-dehydroquinate synthase [Candidatus Kaiserbacteria bacterium]